MALADELDALIAAAESEHHRIDEAAHAVANVIRASQQLDQLLHQWDEWRSYTGQRLMHALPPQVDVRRIADQIMMERVLQ